MIVDYLSDRIRQFGDFSFCALWLRKVRLLSEECQSRLACAMGRRLLKDASGHEAGTLHTERHTSPPISPELFSWLAQIISDND